MSNRMNSEYWYTKKYWPVIAALLFLLLCYQFAVKPTLRLRHEYRMLKSGEEERQSNLRQLAQLRAEVKAGQLMDTDGADDRHQPVPAEPEHIISLAGKYQTAVRNMPRPTRFGTADLQVDYGNYELSGSFIQLVSLVRDIEKQPDIDLIGLRFIRKTNAVTRQPELLLQLQTVQVIVE